MHTRRTSPKYAGALLTGALLLAATSHAAANENRDKSQANASDSSHHASSAAAGGFAQIEIAPENVDERTAETIAGKDVRGTNGNYIGNVADVVVDCQSGKIAFFVVSSGGVAGIADTLRLVPYGALERATNADGYTATVTEAQWDKLPAIDEQDFEAGRITVTADRQRQLAELNLDNANTSTDDATTRGEFGQRLARAAQLRGKAVRANRQEVGDIEGIVLDWDRGTATALLDADDDFASADHDYLVPLNQFQFTAGRDALTTTLAEADFPNASAAMDRNAVADAATVGASSTAAGPRVATDNARAPANAEAQDTTTSGRMPNSQNTDGDEQLTPTGRDDNADPNRNASPTLQSAARSVRQIWDAHPELAKLDLRVTPEDGRLVFRGSVPNTELWERAKDTAEDVVRGVEIQNRISIGQTR